MIQLSPSLLAADMANLEKDALRMQNAGADFLHVDCMDGVFVPNLSFGPAVVQRLHQLVKTPLDVHVMQIHPEQYIETYAKAGASMITVHAEATNHLQRVLSMIRQFGCRAGVALCPATPLEAIQYVLPDIDLLLIMTVNPGYGGQKFIPQMLPKIRDARKILDQANSAAFLEMDGGVTEENASAIVCAGADLLVAGTCLLKSPDAERSMRVLRGI